MGRMVESLTQNRLRLRPLLRLVSKLRLLVSRRLQRLLQRRHRLKAARLLSRPGDLNLSRPNLKAVAMMIYHSKATGLLLNQTPLAWTLAIR